MNSQQQQSVNSGSFALIWYYWFKKYMQRKSKKSTSLQELINLKQKYRIEAIEAHGQQNTLNIKQKIQQIKEKARSSSPLNVQSSLSATTSNTNSLTNPPLFYTINPEVEAKQIQQVLLSDCEQGNESQYNQQAKQMINELHSYYLNSKSIFVIYKLQKDSPFQQTVSKLLNSSYGEGSLRTSKLNLSSILNQDDSLGGVDRNDSILDSYDKMQDRIDNLEIIDKFTDADGLQIWNVKYFNIPHCLVKIKKNYWAKSFGQNGTSNLGGPTFNNIIHPSQPKAISSLPIIPRIQKHRPSIDKLQPFISFMQLLWSKSPSMNPTCESIFQYNGLPYIFTQDYKQQNIAVLCYYIVYGNQQGTLTQKFVNRWVQTNPNTSLAKAIKYMRQIVKQKNSQNNSNQVAMKGLFNQGDVIW